MIIYANNAITMTNCDSCLAYIHNKLDSSVLFLKLLFLIMWA